jgi:hypothetical protein
MWASSQHKTGITATAAGSHSDEEAATAMLLALDDADDSGFGGFDGGDGDERDYDVISSRLAAQDDDVQDAATRLQRQRQHETELQAEEYEELERVYQQHIKRSIRTMRRMPCEPPPTAMCTEEDEDALYDATHSPCEAEPVGTTPWGSAGARPRLHYDQEVYDAQGSASSMSPPREDSTDVVSAVVGASPTHYERAAREALANGGPTEAVGARPPSGRSRFVNRVRRARLDAANNSADDYCGE